MPKNKHAEVLQFVCNSNTYESHEQLGSALGADPGQIAVHHFTDKNDTMASTKTRLLPNNHTIIHAPARQLHTT